MTGQAEVRKDCVFSKEGRSSQVVERDSVESGWSCPNSVHLSVQLMTQHFQISVVWAISISGFSITFLGIGGNNDEDLMPTPFK